jgi:hypothetical protein
MKLDLTKIEGLSRGAEKSIGRCPACAENGCDRKQEHLVIYPNGSFGCVAHQGDKEHNRRILSLAGVRGGKRSSRATSIPGTFLGREFSFTRPYYPKLDAAGKAPIKHSCLFSLLGKGAAKKGEGG